LKTNPISPCRFSRLISFRPASPTTVPASRHTTAKVSQSPSALSTVSSQIVEIIAGKRAQNQPVRLNGTVRAEHWRMLAQEPAGRRTSPPDSFTDAALFDVPLEGCATVVMFAKLRLGRWPSR
jgi:hypothetical protein